MRFSEKWLAVAVEVGRLRRIGTTGIITTVAGSARNYFEAGYSGDGGPAINAKMKEIRGFAMGTDGSLYIADYQGEQYRTQRGVSMMRWGDWH